MKERVLHISSWFPNKSRPYEAIWVKRHIQSLEPFFDQDILHLQVTKGSWNYTHTVDSNLRTVILQTPVSSWRAREVFNSVLLCLILLSHYNNKGYRLCNFHIAYPNLLWESLWKRILKAPILITEHWSFYHFNFFSKKKLNRIKNIFKKDIPLICVSSSLERDIADFSGTAQNAHIVPNVVDSAVFIAQNKKREEHFLMTAFWKSPKQPMEVFRAIRKLKEEGVEIHVRVGGYGPLWEQMQALAVELELGDQLKFIGKLTPEQLADELNSCKAFVLPSEYETFSVVCAEALCCGTPVIASKVGAIQEYVNESNGKLVDGDWVEVLRSIGEFNHAEIAETAVEMFGKAAVGRKYADVINRYKI